MSAALSFEVTLDAQGNRIRSIISSDQPEHTPERRLMLPFFSPKAVERYREHTRKLCRRLIREFIEDATPAAGEAATYGTVRER